MANQAWQIAAKSTLSLATLDTPIPKPGANQALIRIQAVSINYRDILILDHSPKYPVIAKPGLVPCVDGAGIVEEVGADSRWKKGDRVIIHPTSWLKGNDARDFNFDSVIGAAEDGTLRRWMVWDDARLVAMPEHLTMEEASTTFCAGLSGYRALFYGPDKVGPGTTVLTQGTGSVSCYIIQLATAVGATVIATSSSDSKLETARELGARHTINYNTHPDWAAEVLKITDNTGVDHLVDVVGAETIEQSLKATRFGGTLITVGSLSANPAQPVSIMLGITFGAKTVQGQVGGGSKELADEMAAFVGKHKTRPQIAQVFEFEEADKAFEAARKLRAPGNIVVKV